MGVDDFGQSGDVGDLYKHFGIDSETIVARRWTLWGDAAARSGDRRRLALGACRKREIPAAHLTCLGEGGAGEAQRVGVRLGARDEILPVEHVLAKRGVEARSRRLELR